MNLRRLALLAAMLGAVLAPGLARAQDASTVRVDLSAQGGASQTLTLPVGKSAIVELPVDVRDILVTNPTVADALLRSPRRIFVLGAKAGTTDAVFFDMSGRRLLSLAIRVDQDPSAVAQTINRILPGSSVRVDAQASRTSAAVRARVVGPERIQNP